MTMTWINGATLTANGGFDFQQIPSVFSHLQLRVHGRVTDSVGFRSTFIRLNNDSAQNYAVHLLRGDGSSATSVGLTAYDAAEFGYVAGSSAASSTFGVSIIDILDANSTTKNKTVRSLTGVDLNGSGQVALYSSLWLNSANAVNRIASAGQTYVAGSRIDLYGLTTSTLTGV